MEAVIKKRKNLLTGNKYRFILKGDNGEVIATSEAYTQKHNVTEVLEKYFPTFTITDKTKE